MRTLEIELDVDIYSQVATPLIYLNQKSSRIEWGKYR